MQKELEAARAGLAAAESKGLLLAQQMHRLEEDARSASLRAEKEALAHAQARLAYSQAQATGGPSSGRPLQPEVQPDDRELFQRPAAAPAPDDKVGRSAQTLEGRISALSAAPPLGEAAREAQSGASKRAPMAAAALTAWAPATSPPGAHSYENNSASSSPSSVIASGPPPSAQPVTGVGSDRPPVPALGMSSHLPQEPSRLNKARLLVADITATLAKRANTAAIAGQPPGPMLESVRTLMPRSPPQPVLPRSPPGGTPYHGGGSRASTMSVDDILRESLGTDDVPTDPFA